MQPGRIDVASALGKSLMSRSHSIAWALGFVKRGRLQGRLLSPTRSDKLRATPGVHLAFRSESEPGLGCLSSFNDKLLERKILIQL
jgi:hypothetical protein